MPALMPHAPSTATSDVPSHLAIIMDGNGRWAKARGLPRTAGHKEGAEALRRTLDACRQHGVRYLTIYAFSSENWKRPEAEISDLMGLLKLYLEREIKELHKNKVRLRFIGDRSRLSNDIRERIENAEALTANNYEFHLTVALSYGSRQELTRAVQGLAQRVKEGKLQPDAINEEMLQEALDTQGLPDPDLLIRTGGEQRLSNFLLWQSAYTEFYFTDTFWPDFNAEHFEKAIQEYATRERRYGTAE